jgi:hypothetical protein
VRLKWFVILWYVWHKPCTYLASILVVYQMNWLKHPLEFRHLGVLSGASKTISEPTVCTNCAPILHRHQHYLQMDQNKIIHDPCHLGVSSGASKAISKPLVHSSQTTHLSCVKINTISNELNQASTWASSPRNAIGCVQNYFWAYGMSSTNHAPILNRHQHHLQMDQNAIPHDPHHLGLPSGASITIS